MDERAECTLTPTQTRIPAILLGSVASGLSGTIRPGCATAPEIKPAPDAPDRRRSRTRPGVSDVRSKTVRPQRADHQGETSDSPAADPATRSAPQSRPQNPVRRRPRPHAACEAARRPPGRPLPASSREPVATPPKRVWPRRTEGSRQGSASPGSVRHRLPEGPRAIWRRCPRPTRPVIRRRLSRSFLVPLTAQCESNGPTPGPHNLMMTKR